MVSIILEILQVLISFGIMSFLIAYRPRKIEKHVPHQPGEKPEGRAFITPSGRFVIREKLKPKRITDEQLVERERGG